MCEAMPYQDASRPIAERIDDLMSRMTLEEKIGQMTQIPGNREDADAWAAKGIVGSFLHIMGQTTQDIQTIARDRSRLGIPVIFGIDAIHGHAFWSGAVVFPTQLAMACSWNDELIEEAARITAKDVRATGVHWTFSPVCGIARDLRWGRVNETFGEDPHVAGRLAAAMVRGYQGERIGDPERILACAKHFAGYSETQGGRDSSEAEHSPRKLMTYFLPSFKQAADAGCATFMTAYQAIDGVPCTANRKLLTDLLKNDWNLDGFIVTDWNNVGLLHHFQKVCPTMKDAVRVAVEAGNDMIMTTPEFPELAREAVTEGILDEDLIDDACRRILGMKFRLGLFDEHRMTDLAQIPRTVGLPADRQHALECARQSIVLLKNSTLLPLSETVGTIAVIGPNAHDVTAQLGDWSFGSGQAGFQTDEHARDDIVTVLDGLRRLAGPNRNVLYARGCDAVETATDDIPAAVDVARKADVAIVVVGDTLDYVGEGCDRADLKLSGAQQQLLEAVHATGTPLVVVLINSKPLTVNWLAENAGAVLEAFNPGMCGGEAIAEILYGMCNPSGKLTVSIPRHVGQQPMTYQQIPGWHGPGKYVDLAKGPLFPFGFGLSYTTFGYSNLRLGCTSIPADGGPLAVRVDVTNTGDREGVEIVQLYVNDIYSSVTTPVKELKEYRRVPLRSKETRTVSFELWPEQLSLVNAALERVVEPGEFDLFVGASSAEEDLLKTCFEVTEPAARG